MSAVRSRPSRLTGWRAAATWLVVAVDLAAVLACLLLIPEQPGLEKAVIAIGLGLVASFGLVGAFIAVRVRGNPIGWILWGASIFFALTIASQDYASFSVTAHGSNLPGTVLMAWLSGIGFVGTLALVLVLVPLLFPDGHLLSPRWRWVVIFSIAAVALGAISDAFRPGPLANFPSIQNPAGVDVVGSVSGPIGDLGIVVIFPAFVLAVLSSVLRYRRGTKVERQQLRWLASACGLTTACLFASATSIGPLADIGWVGAFMTISLMPIAVGVAITRYRLYEIDRIVSRTISYLIVTGVLAVVFVAGILLFSAVLAPVIGENPIAVAASTLVVAAIFQPLRTRVQRVMDRRFNRSRYDAERISAAFSGRLRDEVDLPTLVSELDSTVRMAIAPATSGIWLRQGDRS
jgi:hypothetical protein